MSLSAKLLVLGSALVQRAMPLTIGFVVASLFGASDYADTVLLINAANLCGSLPTLAVTPQILRTLDERMAIWLASRGFLAGTPFIFAATLSVSGYMGSIGDAFFLFTYSSGVFVFGIAQAILNQQMRHFDALVHAGAISILSLVSGLCVYGFDASSSAFRVLLGVTMLLLSLASFFLARRQNLKAGNAFPGTQLAADFSNAIWSGVFSALVLGGLFVSNYRVKMSGSHSDYVAFSLGLQMFAVVVFVPGAMSSYFVPKLVRANSASARQSMNAAVQSYLVVGLLAFFGAVALSPWLLRYLDQQPSTRQFEIFVLIQAAAMLAAVNAAYNQVLVVLGRFAFMAGLSLVWLTTMLCVQLFQDGGTWIALSLVVAYGTLVVTSGLGCHRALLAAQARAS